MLLSGREKIALVVDDEVFARLFALQVLLDEGFVVIEAEDAREGLEMLDRNDDVAVVFTDVRMPGDMDGIGLSLWVRDHRPEVAVVLTSGQVDVHRMQLPDNARFLPKPYTAHALMTAIRETGLG
jgi:two-component system, response regulator PdtaR